MRRPRITIANLLGVVAFIGVAFAALRRPTAAWDSALFGLALLGLLVSVLLSVNRTGERRAYWLGFSLSGWAYLVAGLVPPIESRLPTSMALVAVSEILPSPELLWEGAIVKDIRTFDVNSGAPATGTVRWEVEVFNPVSSLSTNEIERLVGPPGETTWNFVRIGHSLIAMSFAFIGGMISRRLYLASGSVERPAVLVVATRPGQEGPTSMPEGTATVDGHPRTIRDRPES